MNSPAIFITPAVDLSRSMPVTHEEMRKLAVDLQNAKPGDVISCPWPVTVYHCIEGLWIRSEDLTAFSTPPPTTDEDDED